MNKKCGPNRPPAPPARTERARPRRDRGDRAERSIEASSALAHAAEAAPRFEKRGEPKVQSEGTLEKAAACTAGREIRTEVKLSGVEEQPGAEATVQQEEGLRRRRRGGRQRERSDRPERAPRENKQMAAKHPHPQQAVSQSMHEEKNAESAVPEPVPVLEQETPALVLTSSTQQWKCLWNQFRSLIPSPWSRTKPCR